MATERFILRSVLSSLVEYTGSNFSEVASIALEACFEVYQVNPLNSSNPYELSVPEGEVEGTAEGEYTKYIFFTYQNYYLPVGGYAGKCGYDFCTHASRADVLASMETYPPA